MRDHKAYGKAYYATHKKEIRAKGAAHYATHKKEIKAKGAAYRATHKKEIGAYRATVKVEAFNTYGGPICICCGETEMDFLSIEHRNGDGAEHRRKIGRVNMYSWLKANDYPQGLGLEVLCMNCQTGRRLNSGRCPHEKV